MPNEQKAGVLQGTLDLMVLQTLATLGSLHGYAIGARIEQVSGGAIQLNMGTLYPGLLRLEQRGLIRAQWDRTEDEPARPVLQHHGGRPPAAPGREGGMGTHDRASCKPCSKEMRDAHFVCWNGGGDFGKPFGIATESESEEELRFHLEMAELDAVRRGQNVREARLRAGGIAQAAEAVRDQSYHPLAQRFPARQPARHSPAGEKSPVHRGRDCVPGPRDRGEYRDLQPD